jgi:23S rRNA pseudouridine2605 synthase
MRINKFVASATGLSRRKADELIARGDVTVNGQRPSSGYDVTSSDDVKLGSTSLSLPEKTTIMLNKPVGYVVSRDGQGSRTIYELLPAEYQQLKPVGRLDKNSSGLLLLTNDGDLAQELTHPSRQKTKVYEVTLYKALTPLHHQMISDYGIKLDDGPSKLQLTRQRDGDDTAWTVTMHEGRNRQIRRTFAALSYEVKTLHRTNFGNYALQNLESGQIKTI